MEDKTAWLQTVVEVLRLVNSSRDFAEVLRHTLEGAMRVLDAEAGAVILLDRSTSEMVIEVATGPKGEDVQGQRFPAGEGIAGWVVQQGRTRIASDVKRDAHFFRGIDQTTGFVTRSILAAPLQVKGEIIGVLELINKRSGGVFAAADLPPITTFADLAALSIDHAGAFGELRGENRRLRARLELEGAFVGGSAAMRNIVGQLDRVARRPVTVLLRGETGTGKGVLAREIHTRSTRRDQAFVAVDCGALAEGLWESELFGHMKGAFTGAAQDREGLFEAADGGTIFLDEIGNTPLDLQARLLHVLQEGEVRRLGETQMRSVDVRLIAATNSDLKRAVGEGTFREDLFFRLNVFPFLLPPLRQRQGDIAALADYFIDKFNGELDGQVEGLAPEVVPALLTYPWPGNIRELENLVQRLVVLVEQGNVRLEHLPPEFHAASSAPMAAPVESVSSPVETAMQTLPELERAHIIRALEAVGGNQSQAARLLDITREKLRYRLRKYGIESGRNRRL